MGSKQTSCSCSMKLYNTLPDIVDRDELQEVLNKFMNRADQWQLQAAEHKCSVLSHGKYSPSKYYLKESLKLCQMFSLDVLTLLTLSN